MAAIKAWSDEDQEELIRLYEEEWDVPELAEYFGRNHRSIISKLVRLKIYQKPEKPPKKKTVKMMVNELEDILDIRIEGINLSKKNNLETLLEAIENQLATTSSN